MAPDCLWYSCLYIANFSCLILVLLFFYKLSTAYVGCTFIIHNLKHIYNDTCSPCASINMFKWFVKQTVYLCVWPVWQDHPFCVYPFVCLSIKFYNMQHNASLSKSHTMLQISCSLFSPINSVQLWAYIYRFMTASNYSAL